MKVVSMIIPEVEGGECFFTIQILVSNNSDILQQIVLKISAMKDDIHISVYSKTQDYIYNNPCSRGWGMPDERPYIKFDVSSSY